MIFNTEDNYNDYKSAESYTVGEESDAKESNAKDIKYLPEDDSCSIYLKSGNVLLHENGYVTIEKTE